MEHSEISTPIRLCRGQALRLHAAAGTAIVVTDGCLRLQESPLWLCESMFAQSGLLRAGEHHLLERSGWIELRAERASELLLFAPHGKDRLACALRSLAAALRRLRFRQTAPSPHG
jgi:hypothetical protein